MKTLRTVSTNRRMKFSLRALILRATVLLVLSSTAFFHVALAQTSTSKKVQSATPSTTQPPTGNPTSRNPQSTLLGFEAKLVSEADTPRSHSGDYITCEFTLEDLLKYRPNPQPKLPLLDAKDAEDLKTTVITEAMSQQGLSDEARTLFINYIAQEHFVGLTRNEALARVIWDLSAAIKSAAQVAAGQSSGKAPGQTAVPPSVEPDVAALTAAASSPGTFAIVESARNQTNAFKPPEDIGCAMSIMGWNELRYAFGQTIADEYIGVQIVVRNVNQDKEFLIHDAEISVDSDLNGRYGRYYSGQDKLVVRGFMLASRDYGRRNFVVHLAQGIGSVMSAASLVYGPMMQNATNVFNAGFLSALQTVWTDHNTSQLNLLNDVGFSASKTDRTVVPKSGTAMFVIFISSKQFQEGWWVQDCANNIVLKPAPAQPKTGSTSAATQAQSGVGGGSLQSGLDLDSLRAICLKESQSDQSGTAGVQYMKPKTVPYKKWSPAATAIFHELTLAVVAGTHFTEETQNVPSLSAITCPKDERGNLDYSKATGGALTCDLTGKALDKAQKLKLRNAEDATDTKTADGTVSTSGDSTKATVKFQVADLGILVAPAYKVYTVTADGVESDGKQIVNLSPEPLLVDDSTRPELNLGQLSAKGAPAATITLKGYHLDKLKSVHLGNSEKEVATTDSISIDEPIKGTPSATAASFDVTSADVAKLPPGDYTKDKLKMYIFLVSSSTPGIKAPTGQILYGSGILNAAGAQPAAPGKTTTSLPVAAPPSPKAAAKVTLTVTVAAADGKGTPTGTVKFLSDGKSVGSGKLNNKGTATVSLEKGLTAASHSITAAYQGDKSYAQSTSAPLKLTVTK